MDTANVTQYDNQNEKSNGPGVYITGDMVRVKTPQKASGFKVSYDGSYMSYIKDNKLEIIDLNNNNIIKTIEGKFCSTERLEDRDSLQAILSYYEWLNDRNALIYSVRAPDGEPGIVQLITYNMETGSSHGYPPVMVNMPEGSETLDIEYSTKTNVIYTKVKVSDTRSDIYRHNILDQITYVMSTDIGIVFKKLNLTDRFVFKDQKNNLAIWNGVKKTFNTIPFKSSVCLLGVDCNDLIYIGEIISENLIKKIHYGKHNLSPEKWNSIELDTPKLSQNIIIGSNGSIYEICHEDHMLQNIISAEKLFYEGDFIEITKNHLVSLKEKELIIYLHNSGINDE